MPRKAYYPQLIFKFLVLVALLCLGLFIAFYFNQIKPGLYILYVLLTTSLLYKVLKLLFEWYHYAGLKPVAKYDKKISKNWKVDILTTACPEEPREMIEQTLRAMVAIRYPHQNWLCDEGNDPYYKNLCRELGIHHVTRNTRENAKAGNINNALKKAKGDVCVILDPDHIPKSDFLEKVLGNFDDPEIGYVQVVQAYHNQSDSLIARAAAEQTYMFYGPYMQAMGSYGTAQAIGANCTFRREALDSIGGHAPGLTEDMHTAMLLHAKGWKSVYVPEIVSRGQVPSTLSAYYKQQLKWARGTFDLWLKVLPTIFLKLSWRQKLHYFILPLYYLSGFITLIDILVPVGALLSGYYPWASQITNFLYFYTPCMIALVTLRIWGQNWTFDPQEKGLHLLGGILRMGSWWIYILGFIYTILNIKVPYIPTPKEYKAKNELLLSMPNLIMALLSLFAITYGLQQDWQPYSWLMALFASVNVIMLFSAVLLGQNALYQSIKKQLVKVYNVIPKKYQVNYSGINRFALKSLFFLPFISFLILPFSFAPPEMNVKNDLNALEKEFGGFYTGIYAPDNDKQQNLRAVDQAEQEAKHHFSIVSTYLAWSSEKSPKAYWNRIIEHDAVPMITWEPWSNLFQEYKDHPDLGHNKKIFKYILDGYFDTYIDGVATEIRDLNHPVFLRFAHEMDNPMYPWSASGGNTPEEFKDAWRYVYQRFEKIGAQNVTWVWNPWKPSAIKWYFPSDKSYPDNRYVDWVGLTSLNYGLANLDKKNYSFEELYLPFRKEMKSNHIILPVMLAEFGSVSYSCDATAWVNKALLNIQQSYPEIKSAVLFYSDQDKNWVTEWRSSDDDEGINWTYDLSEIRTNIQKFKDPNIRYIADDEHAIFNDKTSFPIQSKGGKYQWLKDDQDFYFKGICYNPQHDWRDGFLPLTRKQLEHDFEQIKNMGANTIRRYEPGIYDINILAVAEEKDLNVLYGFWFDPEIDYYLDSAAQEDYEEKVLYYVNKYKGNKTIIAWNLGNESWGLQKKYFAKPYLSYTRKAYLQFLERLAKKIHEIDPSRPIFASEELEHYQLPATVYEMQEHLPSVDVIGINAYYESNMKILNKTFIEFDSLRPYVITEFGPKGYWSKEFGDYRYDSLLLEASSLSKANWYQKQWKQYIAKDKGKNLGGFAFSWRDRYEGSNTWFGITDYKGRLKPSYFALKDVWTGYSSEKTFPELHIVGSWYPIKVNQTFWSAVGESSWLGAAIANDYDKNLTYEWEVFEQTNWEKVDLIKNGLIGNKFVEMNIPKKVGDYRIYVYATDSLGNVTTASRPLIVSD